MRPISRLFSITIMRRSQRILIQPTQDQERLFAGSCGLSRFAWNWALALCQRHYRMFGKKTGHKRPSAYTLMRHWNKVKDRRFPWVREYSKLIPEECFKKLDLAFQDAFARMKAGQLAGFPRFRRKGVHESFQVVPSGDRPMARVAKRFRIPRVGLVKCQTILRWPNGKHVYGRVKYKAGRWWLTLTYEFPDPKPGPHTGPSCGIDLGCTTFATVASDGKIVDELAPPKPYAKANRRLKRLQRIASRKMKGGKNRRKAVMRLARQHERVANTRVNFLHQFTSRLVKRYGVIVLENLSVKGMMAGMLAGTIRDMGFGQFRRQMEYKAEVTGSQVVLADRFYPSSKTCSHCGKVKAKLSLSERTWTCEGCGTIHNRDHNAAVNLEKLGQGLPESTPAETGGASKGSNARRGAGRGSRNAKKSRK